MQARKQAPTAAARARQTLMSVVRTPPEELTVEEIIAAKPPIKVVREFFAAQVEAVNERAEAEEDE